MIKDYYQKKYSQSLELNPVSIREIFYLRDLPCDLYHSNDKIKFEKYLTRGAYLDRRLLGNMIKKGITRLYCHQEDKIQLMQVQLTELVQVTRSLSIGDSDEKCKRMMALMTLNLHYLYEDPTNDELLSMMYRASRSMAQFLYKNRDKHTFVYYEYCKQKHYYLYAQPFLSSLFLIGVLCQAQVFGPKELENFYMASYFKDIGMSAIPREKFDQPHLGPIEMRLMNRHAIHSVEILTGRVPFNNLFLKVIENHHSFSVLNKKIQEHYPSSPVETNEEGEETVIGLETMLVNMTDILAAMISERPYRPATPLYDALELVKFYIGDDYPVEFKLFVQYFRSFFKNSLKE